MGPLLIPLLIIAAVVLNVRKLGKEKAQREKADRPGRVFPAEGAPVRPEGKRAPDPAFGPWPEDFPPVKKTAPSRQPATPPPEPARRGAEKGGSLKYDSPEGCLGRSPDEPLTPHSDDHVVEPSREGGHPHVEGMTGPCPPSGIPPKTEAPKPPAPAPIGLRGAVMASEVLARPRALRRGRI